MAKLQSLLKDTAIYGLSSIVGRFLNYLMVPLYTHCMPKDSGDYGVSTNMYAYTALILVILTFGMETTLFRFANKEGERPDTVFSTAMLVVSALTAVFLGLVFGFITPICNVLQYADHHEYVMMMACVVAMDALQAIPFSYLRFQKRPIRFASLKLLFIILNICLNLIYFLWLGKTQVYYVFLINLWCTGAITLLFVPGLVRIHWSIDWGLLRRMLSYSWPILILGIAGILNQAADKMLYPLVKPGLDGQVELGVYGACVKVAMIMAMITQAFRYAYEPFVFAQSREKDQNETYALGMKYFIIFTLLAFLCVMAWLPLLRHLIGRAYWEGLGVIPIVMAAEIMMGVYFNLSFWYKLIDKTIYGAIFSVVGCTVLLLINLLLIPRIGYMACAWGGFAGYGTAMVLSYVVGQAKNPINYPMRSIGTYTLLAALFFAVIQWGIPALIPEQMTALRLAAGTMVVVLFAAHIVHHDFPLRSMPYIGKYFRR